MTETTTEPDRHFEVRFLVHPFAQSAEEAYLMAVDSLIRYGTDAFHPVVTDPETDQKWLMVDGKFITGEAFDEALTEMAALMEKASADDSDTSGA